MLFDNINEENKIKIKYLISKFGIGEYFGPVFEAKKGKKLKINGNFSSNYDLVSYFMSLSDKIKIKKGKFFVPKDLDYETNLTIKKEKVKSIYREIDVEGEGYFKADYFIFIGDMENEFGKLKSKKKDPQDENDKNFLKIVEISLKKDVSFPYDFEEEFKYKTKIIIKKIDLKGLEKLPASEKRLKAKREIKIEKEVIIDGKTKREELNLDV
jgi:hypothetical protein